AVGRQGGRKPGGEEVGGEQLGGGLDGRVGLGNIATVVPGGPGERVGEVDKVVEDGDETQEDIGGVWAAAGDVALEPGGGPEAVGREVPIGGREGGIGVGRGRRARVGAAWIDE